MLHSSYESSVWQNIPSLIFAKKQTDEKQTNKQKYKKKKKKKKKKKHTHTHTQNVVCLFVLRFYGPVNPMGSCRARSVCLTTLLLGRLA